MKRRHVLGALAAAVATGAVSRRAAATPTLRPPGALPPGEFEQACIGCARCAEVCPENAIRFGLGSWLSGGMPTLETNAAACTLCMKCPAVCPTGALLPCPPEAVHIGVPELTRPKCLPWRGEASCRLCYQVCPYPDRAVELVGPQAAPLFHAEACVGCGLCEVACPDRAKAIRIVPTKEPR